MISAAYDYSFSPDNSARCGFYWSYEQQRNTMATELAATETALIELSKSMRLYDFTKTVNALPRDKAALINRKVLRQVAENLSEMPATRDQRLAVMNVFVAKFGPFA